MTKISVFYRPEQSSDAANSFSPSAGKPAKVVADWLSRPEIADYIQIQNFEPASDEVLCGAHDPAYVKGVLSGRIENGFGNHNLEIANSLRYTTGSLLAAAKHVLTERIDSDLKAAISPTSGFHHAGHAFGGGYCTFNGLIATAVEVYRLGLAKHILILDMDRHYGNGTQDIIKKLGLDYIDHITACSSYDTAEEALDASLLLRNLPSRRTYDLVLYQAGADIHVNDPLGGLLTTAQMKQRDANVFSGCVVQGTPIVWNLAGGYQRDKAGTIEPVLALHRQTVAQCLRYSGAYKNQQKESE